MISKYCIAQIVYPCRARRRLRLQNPNCVSPIASPQAPDDAPCASGLLSPASSLSASQPRAKLKSGRNAPSRDSRNTKKKTHKLIIIIDSKRRVGCATAAGVWTHRYVQARLYVYCGNLSYTMIYRLRYVHMRSCNAFLRPARPEPGGTRRI